MSDLVPYRGYSFDTEDLPRSTGGPLPGKYQGVHFTLSANMNQLILDKINLWFEDRDDIIIVFEGQTATGFDFIILEWEEVEIDPLFLKILEHDEGVQDYSVYTRDLVYEEA